MRRLSAPQTATSSRSGQAIGLAPGFNSLTKNSLNVYIHKFKKVHLLDNVRALYMSNIPAKARNMSTAKDR